jgi:hypothetical protein
MSHFAKALDGTVVQVIVADTEFFDTFVDTSAGEWIQTSYNTYGNQHPNNTPLRGNFAGIGYTYDRDNDVFYAPQPFPSWTLNETTWLWEAPVAYPDDGKTYKWNEDSLAWNEVEA